MGEGVAVINGGLGDILAEVGRWGSQLGEHLGEEHSR
jgi:hypothetical protein